MSRFNNLKAELAREDIKTKDLAKNLNVTSSTLNCKLRGVSEFTLSEMLKIKSIISTEHTLDYLFATN